MKQIKENYEDQKLNQNISVEVKCKNCIKNKEQVNSIECTHCRNKKMNYYLSSAKSWKCTNCKNHFTIDDITQDSILNQKSLLP